VTRLSLTACEVPDVKRPARCALAHVPENRALPSGRVVPLKVVVLPASRSPAAPDPVVYLAGGPGEAATDEVADVLEQFSAVSEARDLVFIDQRGTSRDSPLRCAILDGSPDLGSLPGAPLPEARLRSGTGNMFMTVYGKGTCSSVGATLSLSPPSGTIVYAGSNELPNPTYTSIQASAPGGYAIGASGTVVPAISMVAAPCAQVPWPVDSGVLSILGPIEMMAGAFHDVSIFIQ
jgi:hypothetical protein